jgi:hypothetical protein
MKKSTYILSTAALLISVLACIVGGIIIILQKPLLGALYDFSGTLTFPLVPVISLFKNLFFSALTAVIVFVFKKHFWPEIVLVSLLFIANLIPVGLLSMLQTTLLGRYSGGMDLAYFSGLSNLMSISTSIASVAGFITIFVCGLSIGAKLLEKRESIEKTENNQEV